MGGEIGPQCAFSGQRFYGINGLVAREARKMVDTLMFILFCFGPALVAFVAVRQEYFAGGGRRRGGWKPASHRDEGQGGGSRS